MLCKKGLRNLRSEVSKIYTECVTACFFDILQSLDHMYLTLYDTDRTFVDILCIVFLCVSFYKSFSPVYGKAFRKTISADCNDSDLNFWHVVLPRGTNTEIDFPMSEDGEDGLMTARNKWLIAHEDAKIEGVFNGLKGENITLD